MKATRRSERGQLLIIFVFSIIGLVAITGLAIDGGNLYANRRQAQNAADAAALAGAVVKVEEQKDGTADCNDTTTPSSCWSKVVTAALDRAEENGFPNNISTSSVYINMPPLNDLPYSDCSRYDMDCYEYVQVVITTNVDTFFAKVLGIGQLHNTVRAVALAQFEPGGSLYGGNSLVELRPHSGPGCGSEGGGGGSDVYFGGSGTVILRGGGVFVNSDNPTCAFKITNTCPEVRLEDGAIIQGMGGQFPGCSSPVMQPATEPYPYPPPRPPVAPIPPPQCSEPESADQGTWNAADGTYHFHPGHYVKLPLEKHSTLEPGTYCVDNLIKTVNSFKFIADGVFLYVMPGGSFSFQGGTIQLVAPGMVFPGKTAPAPIPADTEPYKGFLIYVDETYPNWLNSTAPDCNVNAGTDTILRGVIYAPHCDVTINGGSGTVGLTAQVIAYTLSLEGGATLTFIYDANEMPKIPEVDWTGLYH